MTLQVAQHTRCVSQDAVASILTYMMTALLVCVSSFCKRTYSSLCCKLLRRITFHTLGCVSHWFCSNHVVSSSFKPNTLGNNLFDNVLVQHKEVL